MYNVYILISDKDPSKFYIGLTTNLRKRLERHNKGHELYSKKYAPWHVETNIQFRSKDIATKFERYLKHGSGHAFLKRHLI